MMYNVYVYHPVSFTCWYRSFWNILMFEILPLNIIWNGLMDLTKIIVIILVVKSTISLGDT